MGSTASSGAQSALAVNREELALLVELLESERTKLLVEIRHTDHRSYRDALRERFDRVETLLSRLQMV